MTNHYFIPEVGIPVRPSCVDADPRFPKGNPDPTPAIGLNLLYGKIYSFSSFDIPVQHYRHMFSFFKTMPAL
jgi:hypothetical protein